MKARYLPALAMTAVAVAAFLPAGCGSSGGQQTQTTTPAAATSTFGTDDAAAQLAAQTLLRNAQMGEESYFTAHGAYPATAAQLKSADPRLSPRVSVISGNAGGYQISATASDSRGTVYTIRKSGGRVTYFDNNGNPW